MQNPRGSDPDIPPHQCTQRIGQTQGNACIAQHIIAVCAFFSLGHDSKVGKSDHGKMEK